MAGKYDKFWELRKPGFAGRRREIFKCRECDAETEPAKGWNGEPNPKNCRPGCTCGGCSVRNAGNDAFRRNYDMIRWDR